MRLIGQLPDESAGRFSDTLSREGITHELEEGEQARWCIWVHSEDELARARQLLEGFMANPAGMEARLENLQSLEAELEPKPRALSGEPFPPERSRAFPAVGALTSVLIGLCLAVHLLRLTDYDERVLRELCLTELTKTGEAYAAPAPGLQELRGGEFWRLFTPVMVHADWLQLLISMMWLMELGSLIEGRQGTGRLGALVIGAAVLTNLGQYWFVGPVFFGMSGVLYVLFSYVWMKARLDPGSGLELPTHTVITMLLWLALCFTPAIPFVGRGAQLIGLVLGLLWGTASGLKTRYRSTGSGS
jgi:GlpG protein